MKQIQEILTSLENKEITKQQAYDLIQILVFGTTGEILDDFAEFCRDNYSLEIHDMIIEDYKQSQ